MITKKYTKDENETWAQLISIRKKTLAQEACAIYLSCLEKLQLPETHIPSCNEINELISNFSDWRMLPTTELITSSRYYTMLANYKFPAITEIRPAHEIEFFVNEKPDVIHEYFGHGPFLIHEDFSNCMLRLARLALKYSAQEQALLGKLFWFTFEFGLVQTMDGLRIYGAGIIPSQDETQYALYAADAERREFNLIDILRTPIFATQKQKIYYVLENMDQLFAINESDISHALSHALRLGVFQANQSLFYDVT